MAKLITPDVRVKAGKPSKEQRAENRKKIENALLLDSEVRLRITLEVYDPGREAQRYRPLHGESLVVRCRSKEAVAVVVSEVGEAVQVLDQLRLGK